MRSVGIARARQSCTETSSSAPIPLSKVVTGEAIGRREPGQITLFDSVGFAIEDFSALRYVRAKLEGTGFYQDIDIIADPDDPRDLFGMLQRAKD